LSFFCLEDRRVWAFGGNQNGQLGVGDCNQRDLPGLVQGDLVNKKVVQIAPAGAHTLALTCSFFYVSRFFFHSLRENY
jgi:alpha-tubulin suppressor-like RCC1 family protein